MSNSFQKEKITKDMIENGKVVFLEKMGYKFDHETIFPDCIGGFISGYYFHFSGKSIMNTNISDLKKEVYENHKITYADLWGKKGILIIEEELIMTETINIVSEIMSRIFVLDVKFDKNKNQYLYLCISDEFISVKNPFFPFEELNENQNLPVYEIKYNDNEINFVIKEVDSND